MENNSTEPLQHIQGTVEALLFVNERPITLEQIKRTLVTVSPTEIKAAIAALNDGYQARHAGITIEEIAGGYQMLSNPSYVSYIRRFYKTKHKEKLSKPALETLAIIAYKQPVTRADVELIRGVNSDGIVANLLDKELIKLAGRKDVPGRPFLYATTKQFLEYFGLKSLDNLPNLAELEALQKNRDDDLADAQIVDGIPPEELPLNDLERQKQAAIAKAEAAAPASDRHTAPEPGEPIQELEELDHSGLEEADVPRNESGEDTVDQINEPAEQEAEPVGASTEQTPSTEYESDEPRQS
ncbi:MAG: SMC-Scp complex subunit ScpB [Candidatus Omnitrophica bacterium]|nr:SMC-Scp complex subunit ScpB [Candidatus Omnitrophota bacterium]MCB9721176.1 SMC-Scp complex subunit ScpB [Candidatus Omnitrophota bacterium]